MTANQIAYQQLKETIRSNKEKEDFNRDKERLAEFDRAFKRKKTEDYAILNQINEIGRAFRGADSNMIHSIFQ